MNTSLLAIGPGEPLLRCDEMRAAEAAAIAAGAPALLLMERAAAAAAFAITRFAPVAEALVLCGPGNNGGDGYAIASRLRAAGMTVRIAADSPPRSEPAAAMAARWDAPVVPLAAASPAPLIIDALFGIGLARPLPEPVQAPRPVPPAVQPRPAVPPSGTPARPAQPAQAVPQSAEPPPVAAVPPAAPVPTPAPQAVAPALDTTIRSAAPAGAVAPSVAPAAPAAVARAPSVVPPSFDADYLHNPPPRYPPAAARLRESGRVLLAVAVSAAGLPERVEIAASSGSPRLDQAALETVKRWRFVPARQGDKPVAASVTVPLVFRLDE